ncbi:MAG: hypothetical protein AABX00_03245 [Nanoarchaeota archaeon]
MDFKHALQKLEESKDFKKWKKSNSHVYFSHAFKIPQEMPDNEWHLGFYNKKNDKITTFMVNGETQTRQEDEVFKKDEKAISEVDIKKIKVTIEEALEKAKEFQQLNYPKEMPIKTIAILQNIKPHGNIWNLTYITQAFNTLNMKIDASTGKILDHNHSSIFSFRKE